LETRCWGLEAACGCALGTREAGDERRGDETACGCVLGTREAGGDSSAVGDVSGGSGTMCDVSGGSGSESRRGGLETCITSSVTCLQGLVVIGKS